MKSVTTQAIMDYLKSEGLQANREDDGNVTFRYQFANFLVNIDENDDQFLQIVMPGIFEVDENNYVDALQAANTVCIHNKVVKAIVAGNSVHITAEILMDSTPIFSDVFPRILGMLQGGRETFYEAIKQQ